MNALQRASRLISFSSSNQYIGSIDSRSGRVVYIPKKTIRAELGLYVRRYLRQAPSDSSRMIHFITLHHFALFPPWCSSSQFNHVSTFTLSFPYFSHSE